jgi:hypothetical protein
MTALRRTGSTAVVEVKTLEGVKASLRILDTL